MASASPAVGLLLLFAGCFGGTLVFGDTAPRLLRLTVPAQSLHNAISGKRYEAPLKMSGGAAPVVWEPLAPLPPGMSLEADAESRHVLLCGTPELPGDYPLALLVSDARGDVVTAEFLLKVVSLPIEVAEDPAGDLDQDGESNLGEHAMGRSFDLPDGTSAPRILIEPNQDGKPVMHLPINPNATEIRRVAQTWDATLGTWSDFPINPNGSESFMTIGLPYSSDLSHPVLARVLFSVPTTKGERLAELLEKLAEAAKAVEDASDDLEDNPLVEEVRLIELIKTLLETPSEIQEMFEGWLEDELVPDFDDLSDEELDDALTHFNEELEKIKNALCYSKKLLEFLARFSNDNKPAFEAAIARIDALKNLIDNSQDFEAIYRDFRRMLEDLQGLLRDKVEEYLKEKLKDTIEKILIKKLGKAAAGAILGAALDALDLLDALIAQGRLEEAKKLYDILYFRMLGLAYECGKYRMICDPWNTDANDPRVLFGDCAAVEGKRVEVRACLRCWEQTPGGDANEGAFRDVPVTFEGGETTIVREPFQSDKADECALRFRLDWAAFAAAAGNCPHAHLVLKVTIGNEAPKEILGGVYRP